MWMADARECQCVISTKDRETGRLSSTSVHSDGAENRLTTVTPKSPAEGSKKLVLAYDYMGRRVRKQVYTYSDGAWLEMPTEDRLFVYHGWNLLMELDGLSDNVPLRKYAWGLDLSGTLTGAGGIGGAKGHVAKIGRMKTE